MKNFIINSENLLNNHPLSYDEQMDYNFKIAELNYDKYLENGGDYIEEDENGYPYNGFWTINNTSFLNEEFPF